MASDKKFVDYVIDQLDKAGTITVKKMFGEYAVYSDTKLFALICDNQLFIKPTTAGQTYIKDVVETPPYPGAKKYFLINDKLDDRDWLCELVRISVKELPLPKPKTKKK